MKQGLKESDLYPPLKTFLESQGYEVKGEIQGCDVVAVRGDEPPVVVELKLTLNLDLVLQAVDRLALSPKVYLGVPKRCSALRRRRKQVHKLLKMLGLGLVVIDLETRAGAVDVPFDPAPYRPRKHRVRQGRLLGEFMRRVGDPNLGGTSTRKGILTAYRQRAIAIARWLEEHGPTKASDIAAALDDVKARDILYRDVYGWFDRPSRGVYALSPKGAQELPIWSNDSTTSRSSPKAAKKTVT